MLTESESIIIIDGHGRIRRQPRQRGRAQQLPRQHAFLHHLGRPGQREYRARPWMLCSLQLSEDPRAAGSRGEMRATGRPHRAEAQEVRKGGARTEDLPKPGQEGEATDEAILKALQTHH